MRPPVAKRIPLLRTHHGDTVVDDYEWLRDTSDPEVIAHLEAENAYMETQLAGLGDLRQRIFEEITGRVQLTDLSVPTREGSWWYYSRTEEGKQYGLACRAPVADPADWTPPVIEPGATVPGEQLLLDSNAEAEGHDFFSLGSFDVSADGMLLVYAVDVVGDERYTLRVRDLATGRDLPDRVTGTAPGAVLAPDGRTVYYTTVDEAWRPDTVWRHVVGGTAEDTVVFHEPDQRFWLGIALTRSRRFLLLELESKVTSEVSLLDTTNPDAGFRVVWPRRAGVEYSVSHAVLRGEDRLLILHNDGAQNFELVSVPVDDPAGTREVLLPHDPEVRLQQVSSFARHVAVSFRRAGLARVGLLAVGDLTAPAGITDGPLREIDFDEPLFTAVLGSNPEWEQPALRIGFGSFVTPSTVYDLEVATGELRFRKRQSVLGGYDPTDYEQRRVWATAGDGARIPVSLVARREVFDRPPTAGPAPALLYGYGAYEVSMDPSFSASRLSLLDRGVLFALAHVRGGGELGRGWYEQGRLLAKRNTFTDFLAVADTLVEKGYATPGRLVAEGGSAGGLLMGAVANLGPERFAGIAASVPFVDPLTSILDPSLPLTVIEWDEWGNPLDDAQVYAYLKSYAPYENVADLPYPRILATTSLHDTRVLYVEPAKWVAKLREVNAPVLLKTELSAGHGGASGRYSAWRERAYELAWILDVLGFRQ